MVRVLSSDGLEAGFRNGLSVTKDDDGATLSFGANPVHEIPVVVDPATIDGFWDVTRPGEYINVVYDLGWHQINSVQRIVSMDCEVDLDGNEKVTFGLNQHYAVDSSTGLDDW